VPAPAKRFRVANKYGTKAHALLKGCSVPQGTQIALRWDDESMPPERVVCSDG
jgi:hypothetical protein